MLVNKSARILQPKSKNWLVLMIQVYVLVGLIISGIVYAIDPSGFVLSAEVSLQLLSWIFLGLVIWSFVSWKLITKRLFDPYVLFLLAAIIFNGGQIILEIFGLNENGLFNNAFAVTNSLQIVYIVTLSIVTMHFGAILGVLLDRHKTGQEKFVEFLERTSLTSPYRKSTIGDFASSSALSTFSPSVSQFSLDTFKSSIVPLSTIFAVGRVLFYVSIIPVIVTVVGAIQIAKSGGYGSIYEQQGATGFAASLSIIADFVFPGVFMVIAGGKRHPNFRIFAVIFLLLYTCAKLTIGTRGAAMMPLLAMLWLWDSVVRPLPRTLLAVIAAVLLIVVLPLVGATRNEVSGVDPFSIEYIAKTLTGANNPLVASISEMGFSATTIGWTMELVPKVRPFAMGMTFLVGLLTLIPNVFTSGRHPALTMSGYDIPDFWLTGEIDKEFADRGGSFGFSYIAEAYLNFGWLGIIYMALLGFVYAKFVQWAIRDNDPLKMAIAAVVVSFFLFYARGSAQMIFRPFIWYSLVPYLVVKWMSRIDSSRAKDLLKTIRSGSSKI
jgi:oligosaccharide repeat unit polymerase